MASITITALCPPKSDNFLLDMRCKSYCNGTNFRGNKFSRIPVKLAKLNTRKVFFEIQLEKIDTTKKTQWFNDSRWFDDLQNPPTKKKNVILFLCRECLSLENIHQLSQFQLPILYLFFPLDISIYPKCFLIIVSYFFVSLNPSFSNVIFLYSLKRLQNFKVWWCFQGM